MHLVEEFCDAPGLGEEVYDADDGKAYPQGSHDTHTSIMWLNRTLEAGISHNDTNNPIDYTPFENPSQFHLTDHFYGCFDVHSLSNFDDLLHVLRSDSFNTENLTNFSTQKAEQLLDDYVPLMGAFSTLDGWHKSSVEIPLPKTHSNHKTEAAMPKYSVGGIIHHRLLSLIQTIIEDQNS